MSTSIANPFANNDTSIFKCDRNLENISEKQLSFYEKKELCDTVLIAGIDCVVIHAHKIVLSALSEYFFEIFCGSQSGSNSKDNEVELQHIETTILKAIIDFMYSGWIELNLKNAESISRAAAFLKMKTLVAGCCDFIENHIDTSNCLKWLLLSEELNFSALKDKSLKYTSTHFNEISKQRGLLLLTESQLKFLLFNDNPYGDFEELVFLSMVAWIEYDKINRTHLTFQLLSMIRYQYLTPKFIIENRKPVCKTVECYELICSWLQWHLSPETRQFDQKNCDLQSRTDDVEVKQESWTQTSFIPLRRQYNDFENKNIKRRKANEAIKFKNFQVEQEPWTQTSFIPLRRQYNDFENKNIERTKANEAIKFKNSQQVVAQTSSSAIKEEYNRLEVTTIKSPNYQDIVDQAKFLNNFQQLTDQQNIVSQAFPLAVIYSLPEGVQIHMFNSTTNSWFIKRKIPLWRKRIDYGSVLVNGTLYIVGGLINNNRTKIVECYDLHTNEWSNLPQMQITQDSFVLKCNKDSLHVYWTSCLNVLEAYNFSTRKWSIHSNVFPFDLHQNGKSYKISKCHTCLEIYDRSSGQRISKELETKGAKHFSFKIVDEFVFIIGGVDIKGNPTSSVICQNLSKNAWCSVAPLPRARSHTMAINFQNNILVFGGMPDAKWVDEYNLDTKTWRTLSSLLIDLGEKDNICMYTSK